MVAKGLTEAITGAQHKPWPYFLKAELGNIQQVGITVNKKV